MEKKPVYFKARKHKPKKVEIDFSGISKGMVLFKATRKEPEEIKVNFFQTKPKKRR